MIGRIAPPSSRSVGVGVLATAAALAATTGAVRLLEEYGGLSNASAAYIVAVVAVALVGGTGAAVSTALGAFLLYDFLFVHPRGSFAVADPGEWLNLLLLLFVGVVVGRLTAGQRDRVEAAGEREREARALFRLSRTIALTPSAKEALPDILAILLDETRFRRIWVEFGGPDGGETVAADSGSGPVPQPAVVSVLQRRPGDEPAEWSLVHYPRLPGRSKGTEDVIHRVFVEAGGRRVGSVWAVRPREAGPPRRHETRIVSAAADQVGQAFERDRLAAAGVTAEVARRSDTLKSALLDSVSHDLRTPLASIRATAGSLLDPAVDWSPDEVHAAAETIDLEAARLGRLVENLLDLSRVEAGELRAELRPVVLADALDDAIGGARTALGSRPVELDVPDDLPPVLVDEVYLAQTISNLVENVARHTPSDTPVRFRAWIAADPRVVRLEIADGGPGVPEESLPRLFDKFYRVGRVGEGARRGAGVGLAIVRGVVQAMGGAIAAGRSDLGGLAMRIDLPIAYGPPPDHDRVSPSEMPVL